MVALKKTLKSAITIFTLLFILQNFLQAQTGSLVLSGKVKSDDGKYLSNVTIITINLSSKQKNIERNNTDGNGNFSISVSLDSLYSIKFSKQGYVSKKIEVNTKLPEDKRTKVWQSAMTIVLFERFNNVDYSQIIENPGTKIKFEKVRNTEMFTHDAAYKAKMDNINRRIQLAVNDARDKEIKLKRYLENLPEAVRDSVIKEYANVNNPDSLINSAKRKADEIQENAKIEADEIKQEAKKYADQITQDANKAVEEIMSDISYVSDDKNPNEQAQLIIQRAKQRAQEIIEDAQRQAADILQQAGVINSSEAVSNLIEQRRRELNRLNELRNTISETSENGKEEIQQKEIEEFEDIIRNQRKKLAQDRYQLELLRLRAKTKEDSLLIEKREKEIIAQEEALRKAEEELQRVKRQMLENEIAFKYEIKRRNYMLLSALLGILMLLVIVIIVVRNNIKVKRLNSLLAKQKEEIEDKNRRIEQSLKYARRIQNAILPNTMLIKNTFEKSFVLFRPRDKVSGDFYWFESYKDKIYFSVIDCTGHGIPGAFMSLIGYASLNQALKEENITEPAELLQRLDILVTKSLHSDTSVESVNDGMDLGLCSFNPETMELEFAGAFNPLYLIRSKSEKLYDNDTELEPTSEAGDFYLYEIKGDKYPIGGSGKYTQKYNNHKLLLKKDDALYIATDGFTDQFGGPEGKKFKLKPFRNLLLSLQNANIKEHGVIIEKRFDEWRGDEFEQVDDVCVMGIKI